MAGHLINKIKEDCARIVETKMGWHSEEIPTSGGIMIEVTRLNQDLYSTSQKECRGCGAPKNNNKCEYCGGAL